jgi:hypothetical protein
MRSVMSMVSSVVLLASCLSAWLVHATPIPGYTYKSIGYWGQNSASFSANSTAQYEQSLSTYCTGSTWDVIIIGFVIIFNDASDNNLPRLNLANHCDTVFTNDPLLLNCPAVAGKKGLRLSFVLGDGEVVAMPGAF